MRKPVIAFTVAVLLFVTVIPALASQGIPHNNEAAFLAANPKIAVTRRYAAVENSTLSRTEAAVLSANPELAVARRYTLAKESARARIAAAVLAAPFRFALQWHR